MMTDFSSRGSNIIACIPGAELGAIEAHSTWGDMEKGRHDGAGVGNAVHPFPLRQSIDTSGHKPVVRPTDELHHRRKIGGRGDCIEQPDGRKL
jgi:hypothetical protein